MENLEKYRYEKKYITSLISIKQAESIIKQNPHIFQEKYYKRQVNNIYLDSINLKNYTENLAGNADRIKIRIRWYGSTFGEIKKPVLELKLKKNEMGRKISFPLKQFTLDTNFSSETLKKIFSISNLPSNINELVTTSQPTLLNSYDRKYYESLSKKHRATIDFNPVFYKIRNRNNFFTHKIKLPEKIILELKYSVKDYEETRHITEHIPLRSSANSKYINGINLLDL